jgi:hypothetical protein
MKIALVVSLLFVSVSSGAAEPVYLDQLMETPLATLQAQFPNLKREGCYRVADGRYLLISIDRKDGKPSRIAYTSEVPCKRPIDTAEAIDVRMRKGVELGDSPVAVREKLGQPDASTAPDPTLKRLGDIEYFFVCRVSELCARHTSVFLKNGTVTAVAEWYSE